MTDTFTPLTQSQIRSLKMALQANGDGASLLLTASDTSFAGTAEDMPTEQTICAISSVPTHY